MYEFYLSRTRTTLSVIRLNVYCASRTIMHRFRSARATIPFRAYCMYTGEEFRLHMQVQKGTAPGVTTFALRFVYFVLCTHSRVLFDMYTENKSCPLLKKYEICEYTFLCRSVKTFVVRIILLFINRILCLLCRFIKHSFYLFARFCVMNQQLSQCLFCQKYALLKLINHNVCIAMDMLCFVNKQLCLHYQVYNLNFK